VQDLPFDLPLHKTLQAPVHPTRDAGNPFADKKVSRGISSERKNEIPPLFDCLERGARHRQCRQVVRMSSKHFPQAKYNQASAVVIRVQLCLPKYAVGPRKRPLYTTKI
jgi:hypothetical protein